MSEQRETVHARKVRAAKTNDRNATIAFIVGIAVVAFGLVIAGTSSEEFVGMARFISLLGVLLIVLGIVFKGRKPR